MLKRILVGTVTAGLILGVNAFPAGANTVSMGPLTVNVPDTQVYPGYVCTWYPYTISLIVPEDSFYLVDVVAKHGKRTFTDQVWGYATSGGVATEEGSMFMCIDDGVGAFTYTATALWGPDMGEAPAGEVTAIARTSLKTPATVAVKAPMAVTRGKTVKVTGKVTYRNTAWKVKPVKKQSVTLQYKPVSSATWTNVKTANTTSRGKCTLKAKATGDGHYRVVYGGSGTVAGETSAPFYVDVS